MNAEIKKSPEDLSERKIGNIVENIRAGIPSVHFSLDDCVVGFQNAFNGDHDSIFDVEPFDFLKKIHDSYGTATTLYSFYENRYLYHAKSYFDLSMTDGRYRQELEKASDWLKFGVHALNLQRPMTVETREQTTETVDKIIRAIHQIAGETSVTTTWRPHYYAASRDACDILRIRGCQVLLTAEDERKIVACLEPEMVKRMMKGGYYENLETGLLFVHTSFRVEDQNKTADDMDLIVNGDIERHKISAFYTHEVELLKENKEKMKSKIERLLSFSSRINGLEFVV